MFRISVMVRVNVNVSVRIRDRLCLTSDFYVLICDWPFAYRF